MKRRNTPCTNPPTVDHNTPISPTDPDLHRLLRLPDVLRLIPVSRSTWWNWVASGLAPAPVRLGRTTAWKLKDLHDFIDSGAVRKGGR